MTSIRNRTQSRNPSWGVLFAALLVAQLSLVACWAPSALPLGPQARQSGSWLLSARPAHRLARSAIVRPLRNPVLALKALADRGDDFFDETSVQEQSSEISEEERAIFEETFNKAGTTTRMRTYTGQNEDLVDIRAEEVQMNRAEMLNKIEKAGRGEKKPSEKATSKVAIVGSGNWACAIATIVGNNCNNLDHLESSVNMWVFEEEIDGRKLSEIINAEHENVKYLPGIKLPENIVAVPDLSEAVEGADVLIFCLPHQFLDKVCEQIRGRHAKDCIAVSLIKAVEFDEKGVVLISDMIRDKLEGMDVSVLMGANLAGEVAKGSFCETTIGYRVRKHGQLIKDIFDDPLFMAGMVNDVDGVEVCGALKNVVALGAGFSDGMGLGQNSKGAIIRIGLMEMKNFIQTHFPGVRDETFFESCGVADLVVTCYGGRNRKCAEEFVKRKDATFEEIEKDLLNGQKLQGTLTVKEVYKILERDGMLEEFPLFTAIYQIAFEGASPETMIASINEGHGIGAI